MSINPEKSFRLCKIYLKSQITLTSPSITLSEERISRRLTSRVAIVSSPARRMRIETFIGFIKLLLMFDRKSRNRTDIRLIRPRLAVRQSPGAGAERNTPAKKKGYCAPCGVEPLLTELWVCLPLNIWGGFRAVRFDRAYPD